MNLQHHLFSKGIKLGDVLKFAQSGHVLTAEEALSLGQFFLLRLV